MTDTTFTLHIQGPESFKQDFKVPIGIVQIGRQSGNVLTLPHTQVSRVHAQLEATTVECHITDKDSSNGTYVNGEKLVANAPVKLNPGDRIKIGPFRMQFSQAAAVRSETREMKPPAADPSIVSRVEPAPPTPKPKPRVRKPATKKPALKKAVPKKPEAGQPAASARKPARKKGRVGASGAPPPGGAPPEGPAPHANGRGPTPPGLSIYSQKLLNYLPGIYHTDFMARLLGIFEATLLPIEWTIDNFDLFLSADTAPAGFLPWLSGWYGITFDSTWSEEKRRTLIKEAGWLYARRGTNQALSRILEIYTGAAPQIDDQDESLDPFTFTVRVPFRKREVRQNLIEALIDAHKPAHTSYKLSFK